MKIQIPNSFMGVDGEEALKRILQSSTKTPSRESNKPVAFSGRGTIIGDISQYLILGGQTHGSYSYPDLLVSMNRLSYTPEVQKVAQGINLSLQNNNQGYIGDIDWNQSHKLLEGLGHRMLSPRQFVDFLNLLRSGKAYSGNGDKVGKNVLTKIYGEIVEVRAPWRAEWLDAKFEDNGYIVINNGKARLEMKDFLSKDRAPGISLEEWLNNANEFGLPREKIKKGDLYYWSPVSDTVAGFYAGSNWTDLYCDRYPDCRDSSLGVRPSREKITP